MNLKIYKEKNFVIPHCDIFINHKNIKINKIDKYIKCSFYRKFYRI